MGIIRPAFRSLCFLLAWVLLGSMHAYGQGSSVPARVSEAVDLEKLITLRGNTHPLARPEFDRGAAPDNEPMNRMLLVLQRSPEQEASLQQLLIEQQSRSSPNFHQWLAPEEFGQRFGPADADIQAVTDWLASQGLQVNRVAVGRTVIEFSGTAGQVRQALHTEIHKFVVNGEERWANAGDPQIPAALAPVVAGIASLNNFPRRPMYERLGTFRRSKDTGEVRPLFTFTPPGNVPVYAMGPGDFATIYNVAPLWNAGTDGSGQSVAIVAETNINCQDVADFRTMFGLLTSPPADLCHNSYLDVILTGPDPGIQFLTGEEEEGDLDVQWSGAVAKGATIKFVVSQPTDTTAGVDLSALYIVDNNLAPVMSESYGPCEFFLGAGGNTYYSVLWEQAAAQGITVMVSSGDEGSAVCDSPPEIAATMGLAVNGVASTPFNIAVGGTDFNDVANPETYWSATNNSTSTSPLFQSSAKSYIPETTWNGSCAAAGLPSQCSSPSSTGADLTAGSGGQSNCGVFDAFGNCAGYAKPPWQTGPGTQTDSVRDLPDVSLFASNGINGSFYVVCEMDVNVGPGSSTSSCDLNSPYLDFQGVGGTSASSPAFAGIMALVNQKWGRQGNANYVLYKLAQESGASCTSNASAVGNNSCIFYDINNPFSVGGTNQSNNSVACAGGSPNCSNTINASDQYGIMVVNPLVSPQQVAWNTAAGYDLATGLGSVNAANLVDKWNTVSFTSSATTLALSTSPPTSPVTLTHGQSANVSIQVSPASATGDVSLIAQTSNSQSNSSTTAVGAYTLSGGSASGTTNLLPGGTYGVTAHYQGDATFGASNSNPVQVTVNPEPSQTKFALSISPLIITPPTPDSRCPTVADSNATTTAYGCPYVIRMDVQNSAGTPCFAANGSIQSGCPTGTVTVKDNGSTLPASDEQGAPPGYTPGVYNLNSQGYVEDFYIQFPGGGHSLIASYSGDSSFTSSTSSADAITITPATTSTALSAPSSATTGLSVTLTATVTTVSSGLAPTGTVSFLNGTTPISGTVTYTPTNGSLIGFASQQATLLTTFSSAGTASITATYSGDNNYASSTSTASTISVTAAPDFNLTASATSPPSVPPGGSATSTLTIAPLNGFTGTVTLSCALPPGVTGMTCAPSPASVTITSSSSATSTLNITTTGSSVTAPAGKRQVPPGLRWPVGLLWLAAGLLALAALISLKTLRPLTAGMGFAAGLLLVGILVSCGGGGGGGGGGPPPAPGVSLSPASLTFSSQLVGTTSAAQSVTLTNTGNATLSISGIATTGTNASDFRQTNTCGASVAAGANCPINVTFTPSVAGAEAASLAVTDNAAGSPQTISLTGTGVQATPAGTYPLTVTAVSGTLSHTANVTLTVQ